MNCHFCGFDNRAQASYCGSCGRQLTGDVACDSCGGLIPVSHQFCDFCGASVASDEIDSQPERRSTVSGLARLLDSPHRLCFVANQRVAPWTSRLTRRHALGIAALSAVMVFALVLRLYHLESVPSNVTADEADNLRIVYHILAGTGPGFFGLDWKPAPAFSTYVISGFMWVFGYSITGMRMASVILSTAALVPFYVLSNRSMSRTSAIAATALLASSLWYLHFSRSGWENAHVALYALMAMMLLQSALPTANWRLFAAAGAFAALGLYAYIQGRMVLVGLLMYFPFALYQFSEYRKRVALGFGVLVLTTFVLFLPQLRTAMDDWQLYNARINVVSIFNNDQGFWGDRGIVRVIYDQTVGTMQGFFLFSPEAQGVGMNGRYLPPGTGLLDRLTAVLFWIGAAYSFWKFRTTAMWWAMLIALVLPIQVFSKATPDVARAVGAAPIYFLFVGLGIERVLTLPITRRSAMQGAVAALVAVITFINVSGYFQWMHEPAALAARAPSVAHEEFEVWQSLQRKDAEEGKYGFNVTEWEQMRKQYFPSVSDSGGPTGSNGILPDKN